MPQCLPHHRGDARAEQLNRAHDLRMSENTVVDQDRLPRDTAQRLASAHNFLRDGSRIADQQRAKMIALRVELRTRRRRPTAFAADTAERIPIRRPKRLQGLTGRVREKSDAVQADSQRLRRMPGPLASSAIQIDELTKLRSLAADDRDDEREP